MVDLRSTKKLCHKNNILKGSCQKKKKKKILKDNVLIMKRQVMPHIYYY